MWEVVVRRVLNFPIGSPSVLLAVILKTKLFFFYFHGNKFGVKVESEESTENC